MRGQQGGLRLASQYTCLPPGMAPRVRGVQVGSGLMPGTLGIMFLAYTVHAFDWVRDSRWTSNAKLSPPLNTGGRKPGICGGGYPLSLIVGMLYAIQVLWPA